MTPRRVIAGAACPSSLPELLLVEHGIGVRKRMIEALALELDGLAKLESEA